MKPADKYANLAARPSNKRLVLASFLKKNAFTLSSTKKKKRHDIQLYNSLAFILKAQWWLTSYPMPFPSCGFPTGWLIGQVGELLLYII